jgi:hypothetical protein
LVHHSAAIPPQTHSNSELSPFTDREITNLEGLTNLGHHRIHRPLLSDDLSGRGDILGSSVLAMEALKDDAIHVSGHGVMGLRLIGLVKHGGAMGDLIFDASQASFLAAWWVELDGEPLVEVTGSS